AIREQERVPRIRRREGAENGRPAVQLQLYRRNLAAEFVLFRGRGVYVGGKLHELQRFFQRGCSCESTLKPFVPFLHCPAAEPLHGRERRIGAIGFGGRTDEIQLGGEDFVFAADELKRLSIAAYLSQFFNAAGEKSHERRIRHRGLLFVLFPFFV